MLPGELEVVPPEARDRVAVDAHGVHGAQGVAVVDELVEVGRVGVDQGAAAVASSAVAVALRGVDPRGGPAPQASARADRQGLARARPRHEGGGLAVAVGVVRGLG